MMSPRDVDHDEIVVRYARRPTAQQNEMMFRTHEAFLAYKRVKRYTILMRSRRRAKDGFGIRTAGRLSGLEPAMVDYLCRQKVLVPTPARPGRGRDRIYSFGDVVMLRVLKHLLECGISVSKLRKSLEAVRKRHGEIKRDSVPERYLVTNGTVIYFRASEKALEEVENGQLAFAFVIELEKVRDEVTDEERRLA